MRAPRHTVTAHSAASSQAELDAPSSSVEDPLLAIGVISVDHPRYEVRRTEQRLAWFSATLKMVPAVTARFVLRCGTWAMSPAYASNVTYSPSEGLLLENATHGDILCTSVPENAGRLKGPSLLTVAWFEHATLNLRPRSRFVAAVDDDAYLHLAPHGLLDVLRTLPAAKRQQRGRAHEGPYIYVGAIHGWSINHTTFRFGAFGFEGCRGCDGPFPFATGSFICTSHSLASAVVEATRGDELETVYALPPSHRLFFHDPFIGQAIYRLVTTPALAGANATSRASHATAGSAERRQQQAGNPNHEQHDALPRWLDSALLPIDVYQLNPWSVDTDGFRSGARLLIWHNRHKMPCRVQCLGEYLHNASTNVGSRNVGHCGVDPADFHWRPTADRGRVKVDTRRYSIWDARYAVVQRKPVNIGPVPLAGSAAVANATCRSIVDLRALPTVAAFNLTNCQACLDALKQGRTKSKGRR